MRKIRKGDIVVVLTGRDKGKRGEVLRVEADRVVVAGVNLVKHHVKPNPMNNEPGGIVAREASIHISNVAIYNAASQKADRVAIRVIDGRRQRVFKSSGQPI
ncbi:MAG: 50S ribosomal protein L24 [Casimicrobiaceae bacterium]|nr:50S ribosomal protein L24 [Casimicrobiaceae bacterium]MCX8097555.1 50S ribosomal protein L24 [Casimicrobiaceae bacterium]MDW8312849.1 50S ribosomal protein L24 [Burkholderiales bacterium]